MDGNFDQFLNNCDNLDEQISVTDFIKTLKKVESCDTLNGRDSVSSSSSIDKITKLPDESRKIDKKASANDLLQTMRKRFVHRATEPIFHALPEAQDRSADSENSADAQKRTGRRGTDDQNILNRPIFDSQLDRKTDSEPTLSKTRRKYIVP